MQALYKKSLDFVGTVMHSFRFLYRCKPKIYYDDIQVIRFVTESMWSVSVLFVLFGLD